MTTLVAGGSRVRITEQSTCGEAEVDAQAGRPDSEYDVCYFVPADAKGNDDPNGKAYYLLDSEGSYGGSHWAYPEHLEVVMTPEQKRARKAPSIQDIRNGVASAVISMHSPIDAYQTDHDNDDSFLVEGKTSDGLTIGFRVTISEVENLEDWV